jgi:hypothetical protein
MAVGRFFWHFVAQCYERGARIRDLLDQDSLYLIQTDVVVSPIIESGRSGRFMRRHLLCQLELAAVLQVLGNASRPE